ncbi:acyl-CoA dehydrogenase-like protein [alpha proteobacterium BAL199]|jgi:alkylation response protein AidB-like acyl-CoA dehydrogenase|nr:acyl-CoA dehydrogenase-like protein [alpha proteobacterium BAL199]
MDFALSEEQRLLKETVDRLVRDRYGFEVRQAAADSDIGFSRAMWATFAELGLLAVPFPEAVGGLGGGGIDLMVVAEAFGRALAVEPYLATVVLGGALVEHAGSDAQKDDILGKVVAGETLLAFAHGEPDGRYDLAHVATTAVKTPTGWTLAGRKSVVINGDTADTLIVSARVSGAIDAPDGIGLFLVPSDAKGLTVRGNPTIDGGRSAEIVLDGVTIGEDATLGEPDAAYPAIEAAVARGIVALSAEAVGAMEVVCDATLDYLKTRKQFGRTIGSFQALQHRMVDMRTALEQARSMAILAAAKLGADRVERERTMSAAKVTIGQSARLIAEEAIQLHGGIAMTWEFAPAHYAKRLVMIDHLLGDTDHHTDRFIALTDGQAAPAGTF